MTRTKQGCAHNANELAGFRILQNSAARFEIELQNPAMVPSSFFSRFTSGMIEVEAQAFVRNMILETFLIPT